MATMSGIAALSVVLAACGADSPQASGDEGGPGETRELTLGYFPLVHTATAVYADSQGIFEDEGLEVTLEQTAGGAQAIPSLVAGEYDITYGNYTSIVLSAEQGLPIQIVAGNDVGDSDHGIMVSGDSELQDPVDLGGKRVAVNNLQNIGTVAVNELVENAGGDPSGIEYVELPYPDMQAALERGDVDAIWQVEPFQAMAETAGDRVLVELFSGPVANMPVAGWATTQQFAQENPEVVAAFQRAMATAVEQLQGDRELLVDLVPTYSDVPAEVVAEVAMPVWDAAPNPEQLQKMTDLMQEHGITSEPFDVTEIIVGSD